MTVSDLINYLKTFPADAEVVFFDKRKRLYLDYITKTDMYKYDEEYYETALELCCALENKGLNPYLLKNANKTSVTEVQLFWNS